MRLIRSLVPAVAQRHGRRALWRNVTRRALSDKSETEAKMQLLPEHTKFRMPDLEFEEISRGTTLSKWQVKEGDQILDGTHMCEIDTPDLVFVLDSGDEGYLAKILVQEGTENLGAGLPLAVIVPTEEDVQPFLDALKAHPKAIEGYVEPIEAQTIAATSAAEAAENDDDGAQILRLLHKLHKEGHFQDEAQLKVLKSLARKGNKQLLVTFKGSFSDGVMDEAQLDKEFFVENATELADEALAQDKQSN